MISRRWSIISNMDLYCCTHNDEVHVVNVHNPGMCSKRGCMSCVSKYSTHCGNHINESTNADLFREMVTLLRRPDSRGLSDYNDRTAKQKKRYTQVRATIAYRYIVEMSDSERLQLDRWIEKDHVNYPIYISESLRNILENSRLTLPEYHDIPEHKRPHKIRQPSSYYIGYGIENTSPPPESMSYGGAFTVERLQWVLSGTEDNLRVLEFYGYHIVIKENYVCELYSGNFSRVENQSSSSIERTSRFQIITRALRKLLPNVKITLNAGEIGDCPVCCETIQLSKLPVCTHQVCSECWGSWEKLGNITCPLCREEQLN